MIDYKFSLELTKNGVQKSIHARTSEENARRMIITLTVNGNVYELANLSVRVFFHDGTYTDEVSVEDGRIVFVLPAGLTSSSGEKVCEFNIYKDGQNIYSPMVAVIVEGRVSDKEESELIGAKFEYQETIPNLPTADSISDDDEIAVYDNSIGKTVRILWSKIKGLFASKKEFDDANEHIGEVEETANQNTKDIEALDERLDDVELSGEQLTESAHTHDNKESVLDELGVNEDDNLTYKGKEIKSSAVSSENQADCRESDLEKAGYIQHKPCYEYGYYLEAADGVEVDYVEIENFKKIKAIKVCDSLEDPSILLSLESDQIEFENKDEKFEVDQNNWIEDENFITNFYYGIEYIKNTITRQLGVAGNYEYVTISPGLYFYLGDYTQNNSRVKSIFIPTETKKLSKRLLPESLGRIGIKSKTYEDGEFDVGSEWTGSGIVDFFVYENEDEFFDNKSIIDIEWEDEDFGKVTIGKLIEEGMIDGSCIPQILNKPAHTEMFGGYVVFRFYSPNRGGYADLIRTTSTIVNNITIKYIEV